MLSGTLLSGLEQDYEQCKLLQYTRVLNPSLE